jgi:hypothetical protein
MKTAPLSPLGFRVILIGSVKHEFVARSPITYLSVNVKRIPSF